MFLSAKTLTLVTMAQDSIWHLCFFLQDVTNIEFEAVKSYFLQFWLQLDVVLLKQINYNQKSYQF